MQTKRPLIKPYISTDIETTGLNRDKCQIIEIGAVIDPDGITHREDLKTFRALIKHDKIVGEEYALNLNKLLLEEAQDTGIRMEEAVEGFIEFIKTVPGYTEENPKVTFAGKNFVSFDREFLLRVMDIARYMKHRTIDAGNIYLPYFEQVPSLDQINKLVFDTDKVAHKAVEDSLNVVDVIRFEMELKDAVLQALTKGVPVPQKFQDFLTRAASLKQL